VLADADLSRRFSGLDRLYGVEGGSNIRRAHVVVVGIGGVGSWAVESLVRSGVGHLTLIDMDHVAESNINRQIHAVSSTVGMAKVQAMKDRVNAINPECKVDCIEEFVTPENWDHLCPAGVTGVIDACDQVKTKTAMAARAISGRKGVCAFVTVGAAGGKRLAHHVEVGDLASVTHDPLLARLRYNLRKAQPVLKSAKAMRVACVFSRESVAAPGASCEVLSSDGTLNCHGYGSFVSVTATFGMCAAGFVINQVASF
jgi:tRNA A37 threonylcarbamoyladenosine dehydratase